MLGPTLPYPLALLHAPETVTLNQGITVIQGTAAPLAGPTWPYNATGGPYPSGRIGGVLCGPSRACLAPYKGNITEVPSDNPCERVTPGEVTVKDLPGKPAVVIAESQADLFDQARVDRQLVPLLICQGQGD